MDAPPSLPAFGDVSEARRLGGGAHGTTWLVTRCDGSQVVVKASEQVPVGLFLAEAEGLRAIASTGALDTPAVLHAGPRHLVLEALLPPPVDDETFWVEAGRGVAALHANSGPSHGWTQDNWLGMLPQRNTWCDDGHDFFVRHRILRFLEEPRAKRALGTAATEGIERICSKFHELVPSMPPVLCHGDLWKGNFLSTHDGRPAAVDPAVTYTWAEVDISMMYCIESPTARFFDAYHEIHSPEPGWQERMELLNLRELLSTLAHFGDHPTLIEGTLSQVHAIIATYA